MRGRSWFQRIGLPLALAVLLLLSPIATLSSATGASQPPLSYTLTPNAYNNTVLVAPEGIAPPDPVIVAGPNPTNLSQEDLYVIGMGASAGCAYGYSPLVLIRSTNGGQSFGVPLNTSVCSESGATGGAVGAIVLPNGTLVVSVPYSIVVSFDGGATWTTGLSFPWESSYIARDPVTGDLYYLSWGATFGSTRANQVGYALIGSSNDGGVSWTPTGSEPTYLAGVTSIAAWNNHLVVAGISYHYASANSTPTFVPAVASSSNGGETWTNNTPLASNELACVDNPTVTVSSSGIFAAVCPGGPNGSGDSNESLVALSFDGGLNWTPPALISTSSTQVFLSGWNTAVFDSQNRLYAVWANYSSNGTSGALTISSSNDSVSAFNSSSFSVRFQSTLNSQGAWSPNLGADNDSRVWLVWYNGTLPTGTLSSDSAGRGLFVRQIAGAVTGNIQSNSTKSVSPATPSVAVTLRNGANGSVVRQVTWTGQAFTLYELPPGSYQVWVGSGQNSSRVGTIPVRSWSQTNFTIYLPNVVPGPVLGGSSGPGPLVWWLTGVAAGGVILLVAVFIILPYIRLTREGALQQKARFVLCEYIREHPGVSFSEVRDAFGLQNGAAAYHLAVLEKQGFVRSTRRTYRRFYYPSSELVPGIPLPLSELQSSILATVRTQPGIAVREISRRIGRDHASVGYNVKALAREGHLKVDRVGVRLQCYVTDKGAPA
jgi:DNA-binding MarR family transcriptional regulator